MTNLVVIGSTSDLVAPLLAKCSNSDVNTLCIDRCDWDLSIHQIPVHVLRSILDFRPNHLLFAAGTNRPLDLKSDPLFGINEVIEHLSVNCLSLISCVLSLSHYLEYPLDSLHVLSSLYGVYGRRTRLPYSVAKHALEGAIKCFTLELCHTTVLGYRPGFFSTKLTDKNLPSDKQDTLRSLIPLGRLGFPEELSDFILRNILSPPAYATGSIFTVDGGLTTGGIFDR
jgi:NAD(P)-dependent dehydrogenase (short-subunit alcohol dehydrogenase family)